MNNEDYKILTNEEITNFMSWYNNLKVQTVSPYMLRNVLRSLIKKDTNNIYIYIGTAYNKNIIDNIINEWNKEQALDRIQTSDDNIINIQDKIKSLNNRYEEIDENRKKQQKLREEQHLLMRNKYLKEHNKVCDDIKMLENTMKNTMNNDNLDINNLNKMESTIDNLKNMLIEKNSNLSIKQKIFLKNDKEIDENIKKEKNIDNEEYNENIKINSMENDINEKLSLLETKMNELENLKKINTELKENIENKNNNSLIKELHPYYKKKPIPDRSPYQSPILQRTHISPHLLYRDPNNYKIPKASENNTLTNNPYHQRIPPYIPPPLSMPHPMISLDHRLHHYDRHAHMNDNNYEMRHSYDMRNPGMHNPGMYNPEMHPEMHSEIHKNNAYEHYSSRFSKTPHNSNPLLDKVYNLLNKTEKLDDNINNRNNRNNEDNEELEDKEQINLIRKNVLKGIFEKFKKNKKKINDGDENKKIEDNYNMEEFEYFTKLSKEDKDYYILIENSIKLHNKSDIPIRFKILDKDIDLDNKSTIIKKMDDHNKSRFNLGGETSKFNNWLNGLLKIPFGEYKKLPITKENTKEEICEYLCNAKNILDNAVYGHKTVKNQIVELITQWITNPESGGNVLGIQGPMGNGKTTLVKEGISKAVDRPFAFITLGGCSDSAYLDGHNYTYEGSLWGKIVDVLMQTQCMNPIIYFDELDKVSETKKGEEIINMLIHLIDTSQNTEFQDKYYSGIDINISRCIFIFSYNDKSKINPILLDRLLNIETNGFEKKIRYK